MSGVADAGGGAVEEAGGGVLVVAGAGAAVIRGSGQAHAAMASANPTASFGLPKAGRGRRDTRPASSDCMRGIISPGPSPVKLDRAHGPARFCVWRGTGLIDGPGARFWVAEKAR